MRYLSVCSGIEAATEAWHELGWLPEAFSEIEPFPCAVLKHHYPEVPNLGDMTKFKEWNIGPIDLLVGGTPCQSFSVAGLREGLADPRGNLMLTFLAIARRHRPRWLVWENVPGVLSSNGGEDFASLLRGLAELGYGWSYRVLDAQYFGVAQRRRRVFVVGYLGDWRPAAAVLFERQSLRWDTAPSREKGQGVAPTVVSGPPFSRTGNQRVECDAIIAMSSGQAGAEISNDGGAPTLTCLHEAPIVTQPISIHPHCIVRSPTLTNAMGAGGGHVPLVNQPIAIQDTRPIEKAQNGRGWNDDGTAYTVDTHATQGVAQAIAPALTASNDPSRSPQSSEVTQQVAAVHAASMAVRRLTPVECERLQGFPDNYTNIPWRKKDESPDGPRYKALGNSMAVPVMRWIGKRIDQVEKILDER